ncbi:hypothetical protein GCM10010470_02690 [Saccharopolyspora taberi]|uniref:Uncharacterized protein n=1 Tax=Saccharopolyspora taberi TaxID=60895 RepID=A0ABN3V104_9PSEU
MHVAGDQQELAVPHAQRGAFEQRTVRSVDLDAFSDDLHAVPRPLDPLARCADRATGGQCSAVAGRTSHIVHSGRYPWRGQNTEDSGLGGL